MTVHFIVSAKINAGDIAVVCVSLVAVASEDPDSKNPFTQALERGSMILIAIVNVSINKNYQIIMKKVVFQLSRVCNNSWRHIYQWHGNCRSILLMQYRASA